MISKSIKLENINKNFDKVEVINSFNLEINAGEFITLLGPSGCGKTTLLRMIAGLEHVSSGNIFIGDDNVTSISPNKRDTSIMFQDYALFPHMNIQQNIGYGLKLRKINKLEIDKKTKDWLKKIDLKEYGLRMPHEISGGQRQRVALARSLIVEPSVLLLDEPLGALDASLRKNMQSELKKIHSDIGITFVYVTHDQEEALSMSTKIVLMNKGKIEQMSRPVDLYNSPKSSFAAKFMGFSNIFSIKNRDKLDISNFFNTLENNDIENQRICFRSNNVNFKTDNSGEFKVVSKQYFGGMYQIEVSNNKNILINLMSDETISNGIKIGDSLSLSIESKDIILLEDK
jgi:ABC-type Fe3+/spermidine/putrescine transport system ATPase subunit